MEQLRQQLTVQVSNDSSGRVITQRAYELGMRQQGVVRFLDLTAAKIETDANTVAGATGR